MYNKLYESAQNIFIPEFFMFLFLPLAIAESPSPLNKGAYSLYGSMGYGSFLILFPMAMLIHLKIFPIAFIIPIVWFFVHWYHR